MLNRSQQHMRAAFLLHVFIYLAVNIALSVAAIMAHRPAIIVGPLLGWGLGLSLHGLAAFGGPSLYRYCLKLVGPAHPPVSGRQDKTR